MTTAPVPADGGAFVSPAARLAPDVALAPGAVVHAGAVIGAVILLLIVGFFKR